MVKQQILPFFIPMEGCPYNCIYCDQRAISGEQASPSAGQISSVLAGFSGDGSAELAFYGGSFTCLPQEKQLYYLTAAAPALADGKIGGIRISTRPDAIDKDVCVFLYQQGVRSVELGIQSFADEVLNASGRGYDGETARQACRDIKQSGLRLGVQLMTGLPADSAEKCRLSVKEAVALEADLLRIYPTLVLRNTALAELYAKGDYQPQSLDEAVSCCRDMLIEAIAADLPVIRMGINPSEEVEAALIAGPYHAAFGGLVKEALTALQIEHLLATYPQETAAILLFSRSDMPLVFGHKKQGLSLLAKKYPLLALMPSDDLAIGQMQLLVKGEKLCSNLADFCRKMALIDK